MPSAATGGTFTASNYAITYTAGNIIVGTVPLTITANTVNKMYGSTLSGGISSSAFTTSGLQNSETIGSATITYIVGAGNGNSVTDAVGTYTGKVIPSAATGGTFTASNYAITYAAGNISVGAVPLTITADNKTKFTGSSNPVLTASYTGFVNSETTANLSAIPAITTTASISSPAGIYPITASGASAVNYSINYVAGSMTVTGGAPDNVTLALATIYENQLSGTQVGVLSSTSPDATSIFTYILVNGTGDADNSLFKITGNNLQTAATLNYEQKASYSVRVRSITQYGLSFDKQFTIAISDVNEAPTLDAIANQAICYTPVAQTIVLSGISAGPDAGQTVVLSVVSSNPSLFSELSVTGSTLKYIPATNASGTATITVTVKDNGGIANGGIDTYSRSFTVMLNALPMISISSDLGISLSKGETAILTASGGTTYSWATAAGILSGQNTSTLTVRPLVTTSYTVTVSNPGGCSEVKSILITVQDDYVAVQGVNILSPNGDGTNDALIIKNLDMYPNHTLKIFDRTGRILFQTNNYQNDWKGTFQGSTLTEGTYFYIVEFAADKKVIKGFVSIVN